MENQNNSSSQMERRNLNREEIKLDKIKGNNWWYRFTKRCFDFISSLIVIILISWFLLIIWFINFIATKGHPIYKDKRVGYKGKMISVYKFRSMYFDANDNPDKYFTPEQKEIWLRERKVDNDPRITKFGNILRKTSLDELPQLFNILFGSLSVIGWRPISKKETENFYPNELKILYSGKPGLTGYWQVKARNNADFESGERQQLELEYFSKRGFFYDLGLIFRTIPAVLKHKGAK